MSPTIKVDFPRGTFDGAGAAALLSLCRGAVIVARPEPSSL